MQTPRILIVENDVTYASGLRQAYKVPPYAGSFEVELSPDVADAMHYLDRDEIDIYVVDLGVPNIPNSIDSIENGKALVKRILDRSMAGVMIHTSTRISDEGEGLLMLGADDYVEKGTEPEIICAKTVALWRRIKLTRPEASAHTIHANRVFRICDWRFVIGDRSVTNDLGEITRLSQTEHAFLRYICTVEDHQIDRREFNVAILNRPIHQQDKRIDNLVYRIRQKLGDCLQLVSKNDGNYRLINFKELRAN
jgi:DNA-binding response OmpR family regulator